MIHDIVFCYDALGGEKLNALCCAAWPSINKGLDSRSRKKHIFNKSEESLET